MLLQISQEYLAHLNKLNQINSKKTAFFFMYFCNCIRIFCITQIPVPASFFFSTIFFTIPAFDNKTRDFLKAKWKAVVTVP